MAALLEYAPPSMLGNLGDTSCPHPPNRRKFLGKVRHSGRLMDVHLCLQCGAEEYLPAKDRPAAENFPRIC